MQDTLNDVASAHRVVIEVGTSTLTYKTGKLNLHVLGTRELDHAISLLCTYGPDVTDYNYHHDCIWH